MGCAGLVLGLFVMTGVLLALIPFFNLLNCVVLPLAVLGAVLSLADLVRQKSPDEGRWSAIVGLVLNGLALLIGLVRFLISLLTTGGLV